VPPTPQSSGCFFYLFAFFAILSQMFSLFLQEDQVLHKNVREVLVDDPIHELEANEGDREDNSTVLINVTGSNPEHFIDILWSHNRNWLHQFWRGGTGCGGRRCFFIKPSRKASNWVSVIVLGDGVLPAAPLAVSTGVMHLKMYSCLLGQARTEVQICSIIDVRIACM